MRWKAFFFDKELSKKTKDNDTEDKEPVHNYGFKTPRTPPKKFHLNAFEEDLYKLIQNIEFDPRINDFQQKLKRDIETINSSDKLLIPADKSTNLYEVGIEQYNKLFHENITKSYKKTSNNSKHAIDIEAKAIASSLSLDDRVQQLAAKEAFVTLKDHKSDFLNKPACRLINPAKSELGRVSKSILERVVSDISQESSLNQWRSTSTVIDWLKNLRSKHRSSFIKFDIVDFYPSITESLLDRAIEFASSFTTLAHDEIKIIKHSRKALLFSNSSQWVKKQGNEEFDVTMGSYDGAEVCELVGLYLLSKLTDVLEEGRVGLYRDDGLAAVVSRSGRLLDQLRKRILKIFEAEGLSITIEINLQRTDFLDVMLDLESGKFSPYRKPNNEPLYINAKSNHPPSIISKLPKMINRRISDLSCIYHLS